MSCPTGRSPTHRSRQRSSRSTGSPARSPIPPTPLPSSSGHRTTRASVSAAAHTLQTKGSRSWPSSVRTTRSGQRAGSTSTAGPAAAARSRSGSTAGARSRPRWSSSTSPCRHRRGLRRSSGSKLPTTAEAVPLFAGAARNQRIQVCVPANSTTDVLLTGWSNARIPAPPTGPEVEGTRAVGVGITGVSVQPDGRGLCGPAPRLRPAQSRVDTLAGELERLDHDLVPLCMERAGLVGRRPRARDLPAPNLRALGIEEDDHDVAPVESPSRTALNQFQSERS